MQTFRIRTTRHTQFLNIDSEVSEIVAQSGVRNGVCHVFIPHTTAGVTINENADSDVTADMEKGLERFVPWRADYAHSEGNSAAHIKASLMGSSQTVIIRDGALALGTWQSLYFCEFDGPRNRQVWVQIIADEKA